MNEEKINNIWKQIELNQLISYFVIEVDNKIIASCILSITPSFIRGGDAFGIIEHVVTHSDYRRRGYGKAIVNYSLNYAWETDAQKLCYYQVQKMKKHIKCMKK